MTKKYKRYELTIFWPPGCSGHATQFDYNKRGWKELKKALRYVKKLFDPVRYEITKVVTIKNDPVRIEDWES